MNNVMEKKQLKRMVTWTTGVVQVALAAISIVIRHIYDVSWILIAPFYFSIMVLSLIVLSKYFSRGKWKDAMDELEHEYEEEEKREEARTTKPKVSLMWLVVTVSLVIAAGDVVDVACRIIRRSQGGGAIAELFPEFMGALTMAICAVFIAIILFNVNRNRVFDHANVRMIYGVGATLLISTIAQSEIWDSTLMVPNPTVGIYFNLFGMFLIFLGKLFDIAIKIKEEHDMTI